MKNIAVYIFYGYWNILATFPKKSIIHSVYRCIKPSSLLCRPKIVKPVELSFSEIVLTENVVHVKYI